MSPPHDDAQREMEQRALRNVRALVDKYEGEDARAKKSVLHLAGVIVVSILVLAAVVFAAFRLTAREETVKTLILPPPSNVPR